MTSFNNNQPPSNDPPFEDLSHPEQSSPVGINEGPTLRFGASRRINKKGLFFLALIGSAGAALLIWGFSNFSLFGKSKPQAPASEVVHIPEDTYATQRPPLPPAASASQELPPMPPVPTAPPIVVNPIPVSSAPVAKAPPAVDPLIQLRGNGGSLISGGTDGEQGKAAAATSVAKGYVSRLQSPDTLLPRGNYIRCVLETRVNSDLPGFTSCIVTEPVYSINGQRLLIEKGAKISGQYKAENNESGRIAVLWERILTPNGLDIFLASPGVDNLGGSGHPGDVDRHWVSRIGASVLISMMGDAFQIAASKYAPSSASNTTTTVSSDTGAVTQQTNPYQSQTAQALQQAGRMALQSAANRPATITIPQGTVINVYVARDIDFVNVAEP